MNWPTVLQIASGITTTLSLAAFLGALYLWLASRKGERSLRQILDGEHIIDKKKVVEILRTFQSDLARLEALNAILGNDQAKSRRVLEKVKENVDAGKFSLQQQEAWTIRLGMIGLFLLLLAFGASRPRTGPLKTELYESSPTPKPSVALPEPTPAVVNHSLNATGGSTRDEDFTWTAPLNTEIVSIEPHELPNSDGIRSMSITAQTGTRFVAHFHAQSQETKGPFGVTVDTKNALLNVDFTIHLKRADAK